MNLIIENYSDKAVKLSGDTKQIKERLKTLGGRFNPFLNGGAGWIFSAKKEPELRALIHEIINFNPEPVEPVNIAPPEPVNVAPPVAVLPPVDIAPEPVQIAPVNIEPFKPEPVNIQPNPAPEVCRPVNLWGSFVAKFVRPFQPAPAQSINKQPEPVAPVFIPEPEPVEPKPAPVIIEPVNQAPAPEPVQTKPEPVKELKGGAPEPAKFVKTIKAGTQTIGDLLKPFTINTNSSMPNGATYSNGYFYLPAFCFKNSDVKDVRIKFDLGAGQFCFDLEILKGAKKVVFDSEKMILNVDGINKPVFAPENETGENYFNDNRKNAEVYGTLPDQKLNLDILGKDDLRPIYKYFFYNNKLNEICGTDAHKLRVYKQTDAAKCENSFLIIKEAAKLMEGGAVKFSGTRDNYIAENETVSICYADAGRYPDYPAVIPSPDSASLILTGNAAALQKRFSELKKTAIKIDKTVKRIKLTFDGAVKYSIENIDTGDSATGEIPELRFEYLTEKTDTNSAIGINAAFFSELISDFAGEIKIGISTESRPILINDGQALIMPLMIN